MKYTITTGKRPQTVKKVQEKQEKQEATPVKKERKKKDA